MGERMADTINNFYRCDNSDRPEWPDLSDNSDSSD